MRLRQRDLPQEAPTPVVQYNDAVLLSQVGNLSKEVARLMQLVSEGQKENARLCQEIADRKPVQWDLKPVYRSDGTIANVTATPIGDAKKSDRPDLAKTLYG